MRSIASLIMDAVSDKQLKDVLFDYLANFDSLDNLSIKKVKKHLAEALDVQYKSISDNHSDKVIALIDEFKRKSNVVSDEQNDSFVRGRFSKKETTIVRNAIEEYSEEHGIDPVEITTFLREKESASTFRDLWTNLSVLLPHRTQMVMLNKLLLIVMSLITINI